MKKTMIILSAVMTTAIMLPSCDEGASKKEASANIEEASSNEAESSSKEVKIGNQIWMKKNLNVDKFRNGDLIPEAQSWDDWQKANKDKQPAWCYYENDPANGAKYGKLYNWYAVNDTRGLAPSGWHVPSYEEWEILSQYLGSNDGYKMKSTYEWASDAYYSGEGNNQSGFSGLPSGYRNEQAMFYNTVNRSGRWWTSTDYDKLYAKYNELTYKASYLGGGNFFKECGYSVRCLKD